MEQLPRGRHRLAREDVVESQRRRLLAGVGKALVEEGFARLTVEDVIANAGVSRKTFYECFESREACLLAAYDAASEELWRVGEGAAMAAEGWPAQVAAVLAAIADFLAADPERAHLFTREARVAGPEIAARQRADAERAAALLRAGRDESPAARDLPEATELTLVENLSALIGANVLSGVTELLPGLVPQLAEYLLEPYLGAEQAKATARSAATFPGYTRKSRSGTGQPGETVAAARRISSAAA